MAALEEFRARLKDIATRSVAIMSACTNEESTKLNLVLPVIGSLEYDYTDPYVVQPEYAADFRGEMRERVDFAIMQDGVPVIAVECKKVGTDITAHRGQLRAYFSALPSVNLGILTNGLLFEFFIDSETPNIMDPEPFLTLDLTVAAHTPLPMDVVGTLFALTRSRYHPAIVAESAELRLLARRLQLLLLDEIRAPSEEFCLHLLQRAGQKHLRRSSVRSRYGSLVRTAFEEALVLPVLDSIRASRAEPPTADEPSEAAERIVTTDRELAVYRYVRRRLAFLAADEQQYAAIDHVQYRDYIGKFAVYYKNVHKGRLFDLIACGDGYEKFVFCEPYGEIVTSQLSDLDEPLRAVFAQRVREVGSPRAPEVRVLQSA